MDRRTFLKGSSASMLALALPLPTPGRAQAADAPLANALAAIADQAVKDKAAPGIQIAVWKRGVRTVSVVRGTGNLETASPVRPDTIFRAGSLTKQFTAVMIARLHMQGRLSLDDRLDTHLDFFKAPAVPTLQELVHHTAGIHSTEDGSIELTPLTQIQLAQKIAAQTPLFDFQPGRAWLYSNANYILLGAVIEKITGKALAEAAREMLFAPLRLTHTRFDHGSDVVAGRATGYTQTGVDGAPFANAQYIPIEQTGGAGAIRSTADDLSRWHHAVLQGGFLSSDLRTRLTTPARLKDGRPVTQGRFDPNDNTMGETSYGFGLMLDGSTRDHGVIALHNGFVSGFSAYLATHLPSQTTVACMCNADPSPALPFRSIRRAVFANYL